MGVLAEVLRQPLASPMQAECIVVQGPGMERWLSQALAERLGVWANPDFPFPRRFFERAYSTVLGEGVRAARAYNPEVLSWAIADLLPELLEREEFSPLASYLREDEAKVRLLELAWRIADTFDHYSLYRPEMVIRWERGEGDGWQAVLWRHVVERLGSVHPAALTPRFLNRIEAEEGPIIGLPERVSLFGVASLPPLFVSSLAALGTRLEVHLYLLSPSREFWAEIRSRREILRELARQKATSAEAEAELHLDQGHPLLASLGRLGRDFQQALEENNYLELEVDLYRDPGRSSMLDTLQQDILDLRLRVEGGGEEDESTDRQALDPEDKSIAVHACPGARREVEVLHDQLVALFDEHPELGPRDVVVMTPDIELYGPLVEAVFGSAVVKGGEGDRPPLPCRVADRGVRANLEVVDTFESLLDLLDSRFTATEVLDLISAPVLRRRFSLQADDLETIRTWVAESGVRWGIDAGHRRELGQPAVVENTWRFGLDRLLLGFAMEGKDERLFGGSLPYDLIEGEQGETLGRFAELMETLFRQRRELRKPRNMSAWRQDLGALLEATLASDDESAPQLQLIRSALLELAEGAWLGGHDDEVELAALRPRLSRALEKGQPARGFLSAGITVCELVPMRTIPFAVVCLLGLSEEAFPRLAHPLSFDLMAQRPMRGDRTSRDDDRYLFLEALLSARRYLWITYTGQSPTDGAPLPPSVLVDELLDNLAETFRVDSEEKGGAGEALRRRVVTRHPLQPWSWRYFAAAGSAQEGLFSYSVQSFHGANALEGRPEALAPFVASPLPALEPETPGEPLEVALEDLVAFFRHPVRTFLQRRLGLYLGRDEEPLADREPRTLGGLEAWRLGSELLVRRLEAGDPAAGRRVARARGDLPPGTLGEVAFADLLPKVEALARRAEQARGEEALPPLVVDRTVDVSGLAVRLAGVVDELWPGAQVGVSFGSLAPKREIAFWISHLLLAWLAPDGYPRESLLIGRGEGGASAIRLRPLGSGEAEAFLRRLVEIYLLGMRMPLPLFPAASWAYMASLHEAEQEEGEARGVGVLAALDHARAAFSPRTHGGDAEDPYILQAFADGHEEMPRLPYPTAPRELGFEDLAREVFLPLLIHREVDV